MAQFKYQEQFAEELAAAWVNGNKSYVRTTIRELKNKAQAAYVSGQVALELAAQSDELAAGFVRFMHPNNC